jgi:hypothetical protein
MIKEAGPEAQSGRIYQWGPGPEAGVGAKRGKKKQVVCGQKAVPGRPRMRAGDPAYTGLLSPAGT